MRNHNEKLHEDLRVSGGLVIKSLKRLIGAADSGLTFDPRLELKSAKYHWDLLQRRVDKWVETEEEMELQRSKANDQGDSPPIGG